MIQKVDLSSREDTALARRISERTLATAFVHHIDEQTAHKCIILVVKGSDSSCALILSECKKQLDIHMVAMSGTCLTVSSQNDVLVGDVVIGQCGFNFRSGLEMFEPPQGHFQKLKARLEAVNKIWLKRLSLIKDQPQPIPLEFHLLFLSRVLLEAEEDDSPWLNGMGYNKERKLMDPGNREALKKCSGEWDGNLIKSLMVTHCLLWLVQYVLMLDAALFLTFYAKND
eukprot:m.208095 g.208095  ORF g.208095 m.208095 type:complete len:228 (+) comp39700_c2_seq10:180-863(+)